MKKLTLALFLSYCISIFGQTNLIGGYAFLENQTDHSGIQITLDRQAPSSLTYTAVTDNEGYFSEEIEDGIYDIFYERNGFVNQTIESVSIYSDFQLEDVTLEEEGLSGYLSGQLTQGIYKVSGNITVAQGETLEIEAGTQLLFIPGIEFCIEGQLFANGNETDSIIFSRYDEGTTWGGIKFHDDESSQVSYARIDHAENYGIKVLNENVDNDEKIEICNTVIRDNGIGIYTNVVNAEFYNLEVYGNTECGIYTYDPDGAIYFAKNLKISNCNLYDNSSSTGEGAIYLSVLTYSYYINIINCNIYGNYSSSGAITVFDVIPYMANNNIVNNYCYGVYNGDYATNTDQSYIGYNNVFNNTSGNYRNPPEYVGDIITMNQNGDSCDAFLNIEMDPLFVDVENYNFHLLDGSPCIDAGNNDSVYLDFDHENNERILDGNNNGNAIVDIGAYEYVNPTNNSITKKESQKQMSFVYPNPTNGVIYLTEENFDKICIYDVTGRKMLVKFNQKQESNSTIDMSGYKNGIYYIRLVKNNNTYSSIIVKK